MNMNKKGLSAIVGTLLIILVTIAAVGIVWGVLRGTIQSNTDQIDFAKFTLNLDIVSAQYDSATGAASVSVERSAGAGDIYGLSFVFSNSTDSNVIEKIVTLNQLDKQTFTFAESEISIADLAQVSIAPLFLSSSNEPVVGDIADTVKFTSGSVTSPSGSGGDSETGSDSNCGNNIIESGETCDGSDLNGQTCLTQGFESGDLSCAPDCSVYNTDSCSALCTSGTPKDCSLQQGVCFGAQQTCTINGDWPGCDYLTYNSSYEETEASCSDGFDNDCDGLVDLEDTTCNLLASGIISSVWPGSAPTYFDSGDLPNTTTELNDLLAKYVNLTSDTLSCYRISSATHSYNGISGYNMSNVGLGSVAPSMVSGDGFSIWKTETSCLAGI